MRGQLLMITADDGFVSNGRACSKAGCMRKLSVKYDQRSKKHLCNPCWFATKPRLKKGQR